MELSISVDKTSITLGQSVTVTYSSTGADDTVINADCLVNPIELGSGPQSGTIKFLPYVSGDFNVSIRGGFGDQLSRSETKTITISVN